MPISKQLILHGSIILLLGLLCGWPYARSLIRGKSEVSSNAWRVAHLSLPIAALLLFALAAVLPQFRISVVTRAWMAWLFIVSSYAFTVALTLGASCGFRGLTFEPPLINRVVYAGNMLGAALSLIGSILLVWGAYVSL